MVATINNSPRSTENSTVNGSDCSSAFLNVSRLCDLSDDVTMNALRRAAEIRQSWTEEEVARRALIGQQRRNDLTELLTPFSN